MSNEIQEPSWDTHKEFGCCTVCNKEIFEIVERWSESIAEHPNPLSGRPKRIGMPTDDAFRVNFELSNGSLVSLTICQECFAYVEHYSDSWPKVWEKVVREAEYMAKPDVVQAFSKAVYGENCRDDRIAAMIDSSQKSAAYMRGLEIVSLSSIATWRDIIHG